MCVCFLKLRTMSIKSGSQQRMLIFAWHEICFIYYKLVIFIFSGYYMIRNVLWHQKYPVLVCLLYFNIAPSVCVTNYYNCSVLNRFPKTRKIIIYSICFSGYFKRLEKRSHIFRFFLLGVVNESYLKSLKKIKETYILWTCFLISSKVFLQYG